MGFEIPEWAVGKVQINPVTGCWEWTAGKNNKGYGLKKRGDTVWLVHRLAYSDLVGPIPGGMLVCHACDVRHCINPDHLFVGTNTDNMRDAKAKGRLGWKETHLYRKRPDLIPRKLPNAETRAAVLFYRVIGPTRTAEIFGVHKCTIQRWASGRKKGQQPSA